MNRKERRAQAKAPGRTDEIFARAAQLHHAGRLQDAEQLYRQVLALAPRHAGALHRLGVIAHQRGEQAQAVELLRKAVRADPAPALHHAHLGLALAAAGALEEAAAAARAALARDESLPDLHNNLGVILVQMNRLPEALDHFRRAAVLDPALPEVQGNLADTALALGLAEEAALHYRAALKTAPGDGELWARAALAAHALGDHAYALAAAAHALARAQSAETRRLFVQCARCAQPDGAHAPLLLRALREGWDRPEDLAVPAAALILRKPPATLEEAADDALLTALLAVTPNRDIALEDRLTGLRRELLQRALEDRAVPLDFAVALARQCFINEYVFACAETDEAAALHDRISAALDAGEPVAPVALAALACYAPLHSLCGADRLLAMTWPAAMTPLLTQQLREPAQERRLRAAIPTLTAIADPVSRAVQAQYEDNPYPRWVVAGTATPERLQDHLRRRFPAARIAIEGQDILVAGCGTGRNALETARRFAGSHVLAVDLSLASLAYALRQSGEAVTYAQADILELDGIEQRFDLIEAMGVLHHLADPARGLAILRALLKPGGVMRIGLYSAAARRGVNAARALIADQGFAAGDIVRARDYLKARPGLDVTQRPDFFTVSSCRDLLFHVQETQFTLPGIGALLRGADLTLLGFDLDDSVLMAYRRRFPDDPAATDLDHWQVLEDEDPDLFSGMIQFWVQT